MGSENRRDISKRQLQLINYSCPLDEYQDKYNQNRYHPKNNPRGIINLGFSENPLVQDLIQERLARVRLVDFPTEYFSYAETLGITRFRRQLAGFIQNLVHCPDPVQEADLVVTNGVNIGLEALAFAICDANDVAVVPAPFYGGFLVDTSVRSGIVMAPFQRELRQENGYHLYVFHRQTLVETVDKIEAEGKKVGIIFAVNPDNPTGSYYEEEDMIFLLDFAVQRSIHLIVDEIYLLSGVQSDEPRKSFLSMVKERHRRYFHWVWGISKDFGLAGLRCGVIFTRNAEVRTALITTSYLTMTSNMTQWILMESLLDEVWLSKVYLPEMKRRLRINRHQLESWCQQNRFSFIGNGGAYFLYVIMKSAVGKACKEEAEHLFDDFFKGGVYIMPGFDSGDEDGCAFRVLYSVSPDILTLALERMSLVLNNRKRVEVRL